MVEIEAKGVPIDESEIVKFETALGSRLPNDFRRFVLATNGGNPTPDVIDIDGLPGSPTDIQVFFGVARQFESSELLWNFQILSSRVQGRHVLPIGRDSGGNLFCMELSGHEAGSVSYCDLGQAAPRFYFVAHSFDQFCEMIRSWSDRKS